MICLFRRLYIVKILPKAAVQEKKATLDRTFDCHTIFLNPKFLQFQRCVPLRII